jgi:diacylglycerol kinase
MKNTFPAFIFALTIIFAAAKLLGNFDYSWLWVFSPILIPIAIIVGLSFISWLIIVAVGILALMVEDK